MYEFVKLERKERSQAFRIASQKLGYPAYVVEKDFWVTYILDTLFNRINHKHRILFKGGTSLSKCYKLIDRFSDKTEKFGLLFAGYDNREKLKNIGLKTILHIS